MKAVKSNWETISTLAAMIAAGAAVYAIIAENRRSKFIFGIDLLLKLSDRFNDKAMLETRKRAAKSLLDNNFDRDVNDLLDFFEMIGFLVKNGALNKKMVWEEFYYWIIYYWDAAKDYIERERKRNPTQWANVPYLVKCITSIEIRESKLIPVTKESLKAFLEEESGPSPSITIL